MPTFRSVAPGGFINASNMPPTFEYDPICHFCGASGIGFIHFASNTFICARCMGDPWEDDGERGRKVATRLLGEPSTEGDLSHVANDDEASDQPPAPKVTSRRW